MNALFRGTATALVTPFTSDDQIDRSALCRLVEFQIRGGVDAILVLGTTGENPTLSAGERQLVVETAAGCINGRVPLLVGTGTNDTRTSVSFARQAAASGADGQLVVGPYYNKPTRAGFLAHVEAIAAASDLPMVLYNVPGRTCFNITADTVLELSQRVPSVVGIKEASGDLAQIADILKGRSSGFAVYAGDDELALPVAALGGDGVISVLANILPGIFSDFVRTGLDGYFDEARDRHFRLLEPMRACFAETNPIPVKTVLAEMFLIEPILRLPLTPPSPAVKERLSEVFAPFIALAA